MKTIAALLIGTAALLLAVAVNRQSDQAAALAAEYMAYRTGPYGQLIEIRQASGGSAMAWVGIVFMALLVIGAMAGYMALKARADREARLLTRAKIMQSDKRTNRLPALPPAQPTNFGQGALPPGPPWQGGDQ